MTLGTMDIGAVAQLACLLEVNAPKPGNVSRLYAFADTTYEHFLASAVAIGTPLGTAGDRPLGETIHDCIRATRWWTRANTNLGIVLLLAPIARAAAYIGAAGLPTNAADLRAAVANVLANTTVADAREVYAAIRLASPGGLGTVDSQDVAEEPTVTLREAMQLAVDRDDIAREYVTDFESTFEVAVPALHTALNARLDWGDTVVEAFLTLLATRPDTHIARRGGPALAVAVSSQARAVLGEGGVRTDRGRAAVARLAESLQSRDNLANPGTTADLTAAAIFVVLLGGRWHSATGGIDA